MVYSGVMCNTKEGEMMKKIPTLFVRDPENRANDEEEEYDVD